MSGAIMWLGWQGSTLVHGHEIRLGFGLDMAMSSLPVSTQG